MKATSPMEHLPAALYQPGTALVMDRVNETCHSIRVPCFDPILDLDSPQARNKEAVQILSLLITMAETIRPGQATDDAIHGAASMLRRVVNLISAEVSPCSVQEP